MIIRKILLATDFSEPAKVAAGQASLLVTHFGAELKVLHVLPYPIAIPGAPDYGLKLGEWFTGRAEQDITELESFLEKDVTTTRVEYVVLEGDPAKRIVEYANENGIDLIVMPAHGQSPFRRFLLGSVTSKVLNDVGCPVWTGVHREEQSCPAELNVDNVVCAVALNEQAPQVIRWGWEAAASFQARLFLVHVMPGPEDSGGEYFTPDEREPAVIRVRQRLEAMKQECGAEAHVTIAGGEIHKAVCRELEQLGADLLVIGRSAPGAIPGRLPTHAYAIVRDSPCPVVTV